MPNHGWTDTTPSAQLRADSSGLLAKNNAAGVRKALSGARHAMSAGDVRGAVLSLTALSGVSVKTASAILTAIDPGRYTVLDVRVLEALGRQDGQGVNLYVDYLEFCQATAREHRVSLRDLDRACWQWSKNQSRRAAGAKGSAPSRRASSPARFARSPRPSGSSPPSKP